jgi:hypothetical protein
MEFEGRIIRVLPVRSGTSQNGNEWKRLPFVFAYYESGEQRWEDRVLLETWDTTWMALIGQFCVKGPDGKVVVENGSVKLNVLDIKCRCGFSHGVKDVNRKDGSGVITMNELKCYKLEVIQQQMAAGNATVVAVGQQPAAYQQQAQMPFGAPQPQGGGETDDLPFR